MSGRCAIVDLCKSYGSQWALKNVTFAVASGEVLGLVGPNGAGKTTLLRLAAGLLRPTQGRVDLEGDVRRGLRYFGGERTLPADVRVKRWRRLWRLPEDDRSTRKRIGTLSRGMRQRLGLESVFANERQLKLLLLDEPWEGLDPEAARWLSWRLADTRSAGAGILVSSHRIHDLAGVSDRCLFLNNGRIADAVVLSGRPIAERTSMMLDAFDRTARSAL